LKRGWIKLYRKLSDNKLWTSEPFTRGQAWADLLMLANHKEDFFYVRGNRVVVQRGQVGWSQLALAKRWSWSRGKVKRFLNELEIDQQIVQQNNFVSSVITIINYEHYQGDGQQTVQQTDSERTADGQQTDINNNDKKEKNVKNDKKEDIFSFEDFFESIWKRYPVKVGKKEALRHYKASVKSESHASDCQRALSHYLVHLAQPQNDYKKPQHGSTWFNNWQDWIDWEEPIVKQSKVNKQVQASAGAIKAFVEKED